MYHFTIIADGPFLDEALLKKVSTKQIVIALDGAANRLIDASIIPHVILGDFDSIDEESARYWGVQKTFSTLQPTDGPYLGHHGVKIVPALDQQVTDLQKAIHYCDQHNAQHINIFCATNGREDLHEGTKIAVSEAYLPHRPIIIHTEQQSLRYAQDESITFQGQPGDYCGFIALHTGTCTSEGLQYPCQQLAYSISNRMLSSSATIHVKGRALLIMPQQL